MQIADDALELKNLGSSLNIWIIPISEEPPYLIEYFLFEKKMKTIWEIYHLELL